MLLSGLFWSTPVVRVGERTYAWADVALFGMAAGEWAAFETRLRQGLACAAEAERLDDWPDDVALDDAATAFRYARDLLTTEETEGWLARTGLDLDSWSDALMRDLLRQQWADRLDALDIAAWTPADVEPRALLADAICSGTLARWAEMLAARAATAQGYGAAIESDGPDTEGLLVSHAAWLDGVDAAADRLHHLAVVVAADRAATAAAIDDDALERQLDRARLDWVRVDLEALRFPTAAAAQEAALCVREDGLSLSDVAIESHHAIDDYRTLLDALDEALRDAVLSASPGDTIGPLQTATGWIVAHVVGKTAADLADPLVRARAEAALVDGLRDRAALAHARWLVRPGL